MVSNGTLVGSRMSRFSLTGELWYQYWYVYLERKVVVIIFSFILRWKSQTYWNSNWMKNAFHKNCANRAHAHSRPPQVVWQVCGWWSQHGSSKTPSENCISLPNRSKFDRFSEQNLTGIFYFFHLRANGFSGPLFLFSGLPTVPRIQIHVF